MPRSLIKKEAAQIRDALVVANIQQALYVHPGSYTTEQVAFADATQRFIAVPPIISPAFSNHLLLPGMPEAVEVYRDQEFYLVFNSSVFSNTGAWVPGGAVKLISLNPGLTGSTLAFMATTGTDKLRINWVQL